MLKSFEISGFRAFNKLAVPRLGRINLVVGKNNVGKTMLLEAIRLHSLGGSVRSIRSLLLDRDEVLSDGSISDDAPPEMQLRFSAIFNRSTAASEMESQYIRLGEVGNHTSDLQIRPRLYRKVRNESASPSFRFEPSDEAPGTATETGLLAGFEMTFFWQDTSGIVLRIHGAIPAIQI